MFLTRVTIIAFLAAASCWTAEAGELYHLICPGDNSDLRCPEGQVIEILKLDYGVKSDVNCDIKDKPAPVSTKNCLHPWLIPVGNLICGRLEHCFMPVAIPALFSCDISPNNFLQVTYQCNPRQPNERTHITCEGKLAEIKCETGIINIVKANFGRVDATTCTDNPSTGKRYFTCASFGTEPLMRTLCDGKNECSVLAVHHYLGKPNFCGDFTKYLLVDYVCV